MSALTSLRSYALLEGGSFLLLLFVAMPLKHLFNLPLAVRIAGSVHGLLFLLFVSALLRASSENRWPARRTLRALIAALIPGGAFALYRELGRDRLDA